VGPVLLAALARQTPAVRGAILDALLSRPERAMLLLDEIEAGRMRPTALDTVRAGRLLKHSNAELRSRAERLLASTVPADREQVLADYQQVLDLKGDPRNGREVFRKNCTACHKIDGIGNDVGPSIADLRTKTPAQILTDIVQPNRAIDNNFVSYTVVTLDGLSYTGVIVAETAVSLTVRQPEAKEVSILKSDIDEMISNGVSLMPEGLERNIPPQEMADVIAFVKNWRYLSGSVPVESKPSGDE
jgi:putative heme-binding domain-containing protein